MKKLLRHTFYFFTCKPVTLLSPTIFRVAGLSTLVGFLFSCTSTASLSHDTFVRLDNQSGVVLSNVHLGRRVIKGNSYSNRNYISDFGPVSEGEVTDYQPLKESHYGLQRLMVNAGGGYTIMTRFHPVDGKNLQEVLKQTNGIQVQDKHPYTREEVMGYVLPPGKYTFTVTREESVPCRRRPLLLDCEQGFVLEIQRDDTGSQN